MGVVAGLSFHWFRYVDRILIIYRSIGFCSNTPGKKMSRHGFHSAGLVSRETENNEQRLGMGGDMLLVLSWCSAVVVWGCCRMSFIYSTCSGCVAASRSLIRP